MAACRGFPTPTPRRVLCSPHYPGVFLQHTRHVKSLSQNTRAPSPPLNGSQLINLSMSMKQEPGNARVIGHEAVPSPLQSQTAQPHKMEVGSRPLQSSPIPYPTPWSIKTDPSSSKDGLRMGWGKELCHAFSFSLIHDKLQG